MKTIFKLLLTLLFAAGFFGHVFASEINTRVYFLGLLCLTLLAAAALGFYWSSKIFLGAPVQVNQVDDHVSQLLDGHLRPLQWARPRLFFADSRVEPSGLILRSIGERFSSSFMCALLLLGLFGIVAAEFFGAGGGRFAWLLNTDIGRGISVVVGQYMTVSAGGFVFAGLRLRLV